MTREGIFPLKPLKRKDDGMNFLTIFIFAFLGVAFVIGIIGICKINPIKKQEKSETEVMENEIATLASKESEVPIILIAPSLTYFPMFLIIS